MTSLSNNGDKQFETWEEKEKEGEIREGRRGMGRGRREGKIRSVGRGSQGRKEGNGEGE